MYFKSKYNSFFNSLTHYSSLKLYVCSLSLLLVLWSIWYKTLYRGLVATTKNYEQTIAQAHMHLADEMHAKKRASELARSIDVLRNQMAHQSRNKNLTMLDVLSVANNNGLSAVGYQSEKEEKRDGYIIDHVNAEFTGSFENMCMFIVSCKKNSLPISFEQIKISHQNAQNYNLSCALQILRSVESKIPSTL